MDNLFSIAPSNLARAAAAAAASQVDPKALFHPVEHAILRKFFKMRARRSDPWDLSQPEVPEGNEALPGYVGLDNSLEEYELENAVARLCLGAIQQRLPQYAIVYHRTRKMVFGRDHYTRSIRTIEPKPVFLFEINWADSAPGISWPVSYHATWIPGYDRWVVTTSADGTDVWGCTDIALGSFRGLDIRAGAGRVIRKAWRSVYNVCDQPPWAYLLNNGLVTEEEAYGWRDRVWRGHEDL